jgi:hypothetical protein
MPYRFRHRRRWAWPLAAFILFLLVVTSTVSRGTVSIQPSFIEAKLGGGTYAGTLTVTSLVDVPQRFRVNVLSFIYDEKGSVRTVPPDSHSLADWVKLNPKEFEIGPKETRILRVAIVPPPNVAPGEYWAAVEMMPLEGKTQRAEKDGRAINIQVITAIMVPVIGQVGDLKYAADLSDLKAWKTDKGIQIQSRLGNKGNGRVHLKGTYELVGKDGKVVAQGLIGEGTILVDGQRIFKQSVTGDFPSDCVVRVRYASEELKDVLAGETSIAAGPPAPADTTKTPSTGALVPR